MNCYVRPIHLTNANQIRVSTRHVLINALTHLHPSICAYSDMCYDNYKTHKSTCHGLITEFGLPHLVNTEGGEVYMFPLSANSTSIHNITSALWLP